MKFLIDECLHTSLVKLAHDRGHAADHVNFLGLAGEKDWRLMERVREDDYTFVTNNRTDFTDLYREEEAHAGLVILIPNVPPVLQRQLFLAALTYIGDRDLTNLIVEANFAAGVATCREYPFPA